MSRVRRTQRAGKPGAQVYSVLTGRRHDSAWLSTVSLATVSAGIVPEVIHANIIPWPHCRTSSRSAERATGTGPLPRHRKAGGVLDSQHRVSDPHAHPGPERL